MRSSSTCTAMRRAVPPIARAWIPVSERLPEKPGFYQVVAETDSKKSPEVHGFWWNGTNWCFDNCMTDGEPLFTAGWYVSVTHWMPLPTY